MKYKIFIYGGVSWFSLIMMSLGVSFFIEEPTYERFYAVILPLFCCLFYAWIADGAWRNFLEDREKKASLTINDSSITCHLGAFDTPEARNKACEAADEIILKALKDAGYKFNRKTEITTIIKETS